MGAVPGAAQGAAGRRAGFCRLWIFFVFNPSYLKYVWLGNLHGSIKSGASLSGVARVIMQE
jgi:hypothetical protein